MKIKHNDIEIKKEDPFANCKLERKQYAIILTEIINSFRDGFVISIDNEWGTGKTTFVKMWKQHLENNGFKTLYFNAWENDFEPNIIVSLISELEELKTKKTEDSFKKVIIKAAPLVKSLVLSLIKTNVEKHVGKDFVKEVINQTSSTIANELHEQIKLYGDRKKSIIDFKESLSEFVSSTDDQKPVVFIIDELDRCRPNYAVELLERIKHLFSVSGIVFVLSIDKVQLGYAVRGVYGSDRIDSDEYLRRFIDVEYSIPKPESKLFVSYLYDYSQFEDFFGIDERTQSRELRNDKSDFIDFAILLFNSGNITLRIQEKIFAHARIALCEFSSRNYVVPSLFTLLIYLKLKYPTIYFGIKNDSFELQELLNKVESILPSNIPENKIRSILFTEAMLIKTYNNAKERHLRKALYIQGTDVENSKITLNIKSGIDKSPNNEMFAEFIDSNRYFSDIDQMSIKHLISKLDLTEKMIMT